MTGNGWDYHHGSHQELLCTPGDPLLVWRRLDAIVVPTARDPSRLAEAARLARVLGCTLVTLHGGKCTSASQASRLLHPDVDLIAINTAAPAALRLPQWETSRLLSQTIFARHSDLSAKRNLGLALSRMMGWSNIFFLDDDIVVPNPDDLRDANGLLGHHHAVGLHVGGIPDHSVVCQAYRGIGGSQESFIGGGAMAVEVSRCDSFFPDIYNDDWFFMLDAEGRFRPVAQTGKAHQELFDPFRSVHRAQSEEFGDVLAEGIYWLLDQGRSAFDADHRHWAEFLVKRRRFIERILEQVGHHDLPEDKKGRMTDALHGSLARLKLISPGLCERYLTAWASDRKTWLRHVETLPIAQTRQRAISYLSRPGAPRLLAYLSCENGLGLEPAV